MKNIGLLDSLPVGFGSNALLSKLSPFFQAVFMINPMVGIIDGFRWCFFENSPLSMQAVLYAVAMTVLFMVIGMRTFRKMERQFADLI
jgi:lipopolysaccharide transport system permease protein